MEFLGPNGLMNTEGWVGSGQTFADAGTLYVHAPTEFGGNIQLDGGFALLVGLAATSASYDYSRDVLTLWNGSRAVDSVHVTGSLGVAHGQFGAYQTPAGSPLGGAGGVLLTNAVNAYGPGIWNN